MAMSFRQIGKGLVRNLGKGAGKVANVADAVSSGTGRAVAGVANTMDDIAEGVPGAFSEGLEAARKPKKPGYQETRKNSSRVQREIAEGKRDADGRKIKEARNSGGTNEMPNSSSGSGITDPPWWSNEKKVRFVDSQGRVYERNPNVNWQEGDKRKSSLNPGGRNKYLYTADGKSINGKIFGEAKKTHVQNGGDVEYISEIAEDIATTETAETAGFNLGEFIDNHPVMSAGALVGGGFLLSELLDDE